MRVRYSTKPIISIAIAFLLLSLLVLPVYAVGTPASQYTGSSAQSAIITGYWNQAGYTNAWAMLITPNQTGTAESVTFKLLRTGSPTGYYRYDLYDSSMVLKDWSASYTITSISGTKKTNYNRAFTQSYSVTNATTYYVGVRAENGTLSSNDYIEVDLDTGTSKTSKGHIGSSWSTYSGYALTHIFYVTLPSKSWNDVSTWTASLASRTWSSGTAWSFNLQTRQWNAYVSSLHEYYNAGDDTPYSSAYMYGAVWEAQTFTVNATQHTITSVKLKLFRTGSIGIVVASIRKGNGTVPTGPDLTNGTINGDSLTEDTNGLWYEIGLTEYPLISNTQYAIVVRAPNANITNYLSWRCDVSSPTYDNGTEQYSSNSGNSWVSLPSCDMMFEVWGKETMLFSFGLATRTWQPVLSFAFDLLARVWTDIATWVFYPLTRLWNDIAVWAFNVTAMMWRDLSWLFYLLPPLPEWANVAVWIFSLRSPEWMLVALLNFQLGAGGIAFLFIALLLLIVIVAGIIAIAYRRPKQ